MHTTIAESMRTTPNAIQGLIKGALYRIQILCRRYTFWSYPAGLTIADTPGKQKLKYRRVYSHHFQTTIAESIHTTPNSIQCPFNPAGQLLLTRRGKTRMDGVGIVFEFYIAGALYRIWCGVNRFGDSGVKVV